MKTIELNEQEKQVYDILKEIHTNAYRPGKVRGGQPSYSTIAKRLGVSSRKVGQVANALEKARLLIITTEKRRLRRDIQQYNWHAGKASPNPIMVKTVMKNL